MELLWLTGSPQKTEDISTLVDTRLHSAVVLEVGSDHSWAFAALADLRAGDVTLPLWVFDEAATRQSAQMWIEAGADCLATTSVQLRQLKDRLGTNQRRTALIGASPSMQDVAANVDRVADRRCNVLIEGETGTGKEVVAREIHARGARSRGPWVAVNCGAIPEALLEAELFGHVKGAFTGAVQARAGKFEAANHGTIFLDEIGEMPLALQARLLRVLQEKEVERLGGNDRIELDVRVIAATNVNLAARVREGLFRQDLYFRLNVFRIEVPALRERTEDIPVLADHFVAKFCKADNLRPKTLDPQVLEHLADHAWPGNVRELENLLESAVIMSGSRPAITLADIRSRENTVVMMPSPAARIAPDLSPIQIPSVCIPAEGLDYQEALEAFEHSLLRQAIARTRGNKTAAAELLRLKRTTLSARVRTLDARATRLVA